MRLALCALLFAGLFAGCATTSQPLSVPFADLAKSDVIRAIEIAHAAGDPAGLACSQAILNHLSDRVALPDPAGPFSALIRVREARRALDKGLIPEDVHNACAPVIVDAEQTILKLGGLVTPGAGALRPLLSR